MSRGDKNAEIEAVPLAERRRRIDCVGERAVSPVVSRGRGVRESGDDVGRLRETPASLTGQREQRA